ncbi:helix-turn-helix transcriptional regulator [Achromobacter sp. UMC71]|uniref:AraC family transcriptional regulator n=1 Tax=Achromobacter sp. UMC71 TaxID=1862320 RepID=UPI00351C215F
MLSQSAGPDYSELLDGPALYVFHGADAPGNEFRLGSRDYDWHAHARGQLFGVDSGSMRVHTDAGSWLLPPQRAGWIPPGQRHQVSVAGAASGWVALVHPDAAAGMPVAPCVLGVGSLLRGMVRRAGDWPKKLSLDAAQSRFAAVLLDEIEAAPQEPLHLPWPRDRRLARLTRALADDPADNRPLELLAAQAGLAPRTAQRLFAEETGLGFAQWRQQLRLIHALERLSVGQPVAQVADALGYATPGNFIAMFKRAYGMTPGRYLQEATVLE